MFFHTDNYRPIPLVPPAPVVGEGRQITIEVDKERILGMPEFASNPFQLVASIVDDSSPIGRKLGPTPKNWSIEVDPLHSLIRCKAIGAQIRPMPSK
jgi:hypothetical protein